MASHNGQLLREKSVNSKDAPNLSVTDPVNKPGCVMSVNKQRIPDRKKPARPVSTP